MKYSLKKRLFNKKLINEDGKSLNLKNSPFKVKKLSEGFVLLKDGKPASPTLKSIEQINGQYFGTTKYSMKCVIDIENGAVSPTYLRKLGTSFVLTDGTITKFNKDLEPVKSKLSAVINNGQIKYPNGIYNKICIKQNSGKYSVNKYGVMDEHGAIICPCTFDSENIRFNFISERKTPAEIENSLTKYTIKSISAFSGNETTKLFNESHALIFECSGKKSVHKLAESQNDTIVAVYDQTSNFSNVYSYNFSTGKFTGIALIKGFVAKFEKIESDVYYGVTRNLDNSLTIVDFRGKPINSENFDTIEFVKVKPDKTVALVSKDNKYGIFDIRSRCFIKKPLSSYDETKLHLKNIKDDFTK